MIDRRALLALFAMSTAALPSAVRAAPLQSRPFDQQTFEMALADRKPMLVEISAPWCPVCRAQKAILADLFAEPRFADMVVLDVDFDSRKDVVRALSAQRQSTLIVFADGREIGRSVGDTSRDSIAAMLASAVEGT
jgi:thioredoxin-like negative regulator of GroEL